MSYDCLFLGYTIIAAVISFDDKAALKLLLGAAPGALEKRVCADSDK